MASEKLVPLFKLGPFLGVDATEADPSESPELAKLATNCNVFRSTGAMNTAMGRYSLGLITASSDASILDAIVAAGVTAETLYVSNDGIDSVVYTSTAALGTQVAVANAIRFAQAVAFSSLETNVSTVSAVYTNTGQQLLGPNAFAIQQPAPNIPASSVTLTPTAGAYNISGGVNGNNVTLYYAFTNEVVLKAGTTIYAVQETSPTSSAFAPFSLSVGLTAGSNYEVTITLTGGASFSGTNSDGSTYTTNVYRLSTDQPQWYLVGNTGTATTTYVDNYAQTTISANAVLDLYRDPPPAGPNAVVFAHRDRLWWMTDLTNYSGVYQNYCTQLWYSDYGVPYSYDSVDQALLVGADSLESLASSGNIIIDGYLASYGNYAMAGVSVSGVAILLKKYAAYILDGVDEATFFISPLLGASGCFARKSVAKSVQEVYWLSERGPEMYVLGQGCTYIGEPIRGILDTYSPADKAAAVGWYSRQSYWLSFPTQNVTFVYRVLAQKWWGPLPYGTTYVSSLPTDTSPGPLGGVGTVVAVRTNTLELDAWQAAETDLTAAISATWVSALNDCADVWVRKSFRYITVGAPVQPGVTATVVLSVWDINSSAPTTYSAAFDLSVAPYQTVSIPENTVKGYYLQVTVTLNNSATATTYATLWNVVVGGSRIEAFLMGQ